MGTFFSLFLEAFFKPVNERTPIDGENNRNFRIEFGAILTLTFPTSIQFIGLFDIFYGVVTTGSKNAAVLNSKATNY